VVEEVDEDQIDKGEAEDDEDENMEQI